MAPKLTPFNLAHLILRALSILLTLALLIQLVLFVTNLHTTSTRILELTTLCLCLALSLLIITTLLLPARLQKRWHYAYWAHSCMVFWELCALGLLLGCLFMQFLSFRQRTEEGWKRCLSEDRFETKGWCGKWYRVRNTWMYQFALLL